MPRLESLAGEDPREPLHRVNPFRPSPPRIFAHMFDRQKTEFSKNASVNEVKRKLLAALTDKNNKNFWAGMWVPFGMRNPCRRQNWLPNERFCSTHIALVADLSFCDQFLAVEWK